MKSFSLPLVRLLFPIIIIFSCMQTKENPMEPSNQNKKEYTISASEKTEINYSGDFSIVIPENSLAEPMNISVKELDNIDDTPLNGAELSGNIFEIEHYGGIFLRPVEITMDYDKQNNPEDLHIGRYDGSKWQMLQTRLNPNNNKLVATSPGFSRYALFKGWFPDINSVQTSVTEYSDIRFPQDFKDDLVINASVTDKDNNLDSVTISISIFDFQTAALLTLGQLGAVFDNTVYSLVTVLFMKDRGMTIVFKMSKIDNENFNFVLRTQELEEFYQNNYLFDKINIVVTATDTKGLRSSSDVVEIQVTSSKRPIIQLIEPNEISSTKPVFNWTFYEDPLPYRYFKIVIDDESDPFKSWSPKESKKLDYPAKSYQSTKTYQVGKKYYWQLRVSKNNDFTDNINNYAVSPIYSFVPKENKNPTVSIQQPTNNQSFKVGSTVIISFKAEDADNNLSNVKLYINNSLKKTYASGFGSLSYTWNTSGLSAGNYKIKAVATDDKNATAEKEITVILTPDTTPPSEVSSLTKVAGNEIVTLFWTEPEDEDFAKVEINYLPGNVDAEVLKGTRAAKISGLTNKIQYTFTVRTIDITGNKSNGREITAIPKSPFPSNFSDIAGIWKTGNYTFKVTENGIIPSLTLKFLTEGYVGGYPYEAYVTATFKNIEINPVDFSFTASYIHGPGSAFSSTATNSMDISAIFIETNKLEGNWSASVYSRYISSDGSGTWKATKK